MKINTIIAFAFSALLLSCSTKSSKFEKLENRKFFIDDKNIADMKKEPLPHFAGFNYSRYKNTSDITWQIEMNKMYEKEMNKQKSKNAVQLSLFDEIDKGTDHSS